MPLLLLCSLEIEVRVQQLVAGQHELPVFGVVVHVDDGERETVQVCRLCATRNVDKIEERLALGQAGRILRRCRVRVVSLKSQVK